MKSAKQNFAEEKGELLKKRRQLLKDKKMEQYKAVVADMI